MTRPKTLRFRDKSLGGARPEWVRRTLPRSRTVLI
jgi:hypothetical protein